MANCLNDPLPIERESLRSVHLPWYPHELWLIRKCSFCYKKQLTLREHADQNINRCRFHVFQLCLYALFGIAFASFPLIMFLLHFDEITNGHSRGVITSEYLLISGFWMYFGILQILTEIYRAKVASKFINFYTSNYTKLQRDQIKRSKLSECYYIIGGCIAPLFIAFIPCIIRSSDDDTESECYSHKYGLYVMIWNAVSLEVFIGLRLMRACHILSYRISTACDFAERARTFWTEEVTVLSEDTVQEWNDEYLVKPYRSIQSITRRRVFFFTMMVGVSLPTMCLICVLALPIEQVFDYPLLVQVMLIVMIVDVYILLLIAESALCHSKWKEAIHAFGERLLDLQYVTQRRQSNLGFADIFTFYVPVYNYWNSRFFGMRWLGVDMNWNLFLKLCSLLFVNAVVYYIKKEIAEMSF